MPTNTHRYPEFATPRAVKFRMKGSRLRHRAAPKGIHIENPPVKGQPITPEGMLAVMQDYPTMARSLFRARRRMRLESARHQRRARKEALRHA